METRTQWTPGSREWLAEREVVKYSRMVIGECNSDEQAKEFCRIVESSEIGTEPGFRSCQLLLEGDGRMVIILTTWETLEACVRYHSSRSYRQLVAKTQHLLIGDFVVKLFQERQTVGAL